MQTSAQCPSQPAGPGQEPGPGWRLGGQPPHTSHLNRRKRPLCHRTIAQCPAPILHPEQEQVIGQVDATTGHCWQKMGHTPWGSPCSAGHACCPCSSEVGRGLPAKVSGPGHSQGAVCTVPHRDHRHWPRRRNTCPGSSGDSPSLDTGLHQTPHLVPRSRAPQPRACLPWCPHRAPKTLTPNTTLFPDICRGQ